MKSKKTLFELLGLFYGKTDVDIGKYSISDETYGRKSMLYFWNIESNWGVSRRDFENTLTMLGLKPNKRYCRELDVTEVQVSYFKGWHWDE